MSGEYLGDFAGTETILIVFDTFDSNGASVTMTGLATTDIEIYKGSSVTQRSSDAGYALIDTDGIDIDTQTGIHGFTVDLSDNTDAGFFAAGNDYYVVVNSVTIDTQTVRFIAARFSIQNRYNDFNVKSISGDSTAADNLEADYDGTGYNKSASTIGTCTTLTGHTAQTGDSYERLGAPAGASVSADIATVDTNVDAILVDTGTTLPATLATIDSNVYAILVDTAMTIPAQITALNDISTADVNAQVLDVLNTDTFAEPSSVPAATATLVQKIGFIFATLRNKTTQTATTLTLRNDGDSANIGTATVSDDGTTATKNKMS